MPVPEGPAGAYGDAEAPTRSLARQLRLLLWKSALLRLRRPFGTFVEFFAPFMLFIILVLVRRASEPQSYPASYYTPDCTTQPTPNCSLSGPLPQAFVVWKRQVAYAPNGTDTDRVMAIFTRNLETALNLATGTLSSGVLLGLPTAEAVAAAYGTNPTVGYGIIFTSASTTGVLPSASVTYTLRTLTNESADTADVFKPYKQTAPITSHPWVDYQATTLQDSLERALVSYSTNAAVSVRTFVQQFPFPSYIKDPFMTALSTTMPLFMVLSWIYTVSITTKSIVYEKELRLKEMMKTMGLSNAMLWLNWFIVTFAILFVDVIVITLLLTAGHVFTATPSSVIFVFLLLYSISIIAFCFLLSVFFSRARIAAAFAGIVYFISYLPYDFITNNEQNISAAVKSIACLFPSTAFGLGTEYITQFEVSGSGMQWSLADTPAAYNGNFTFADTLAFLVADTVIYLLLAFYIEAVFPGEYGVPQPWNFFLTRAFWCGNRGPRRAAGGGATDAMEMHGMSDGPGPSAAVMEPPAEGARAGIRFVNVTKQYDSQKIVIDRLSLTLYEGQVTALLGHNGAGKTTAMNMMVGIIPSTSGDIFVNGYNVATDISTIRGSLGMCPQHNVLFDALTVREHLVFYAGLKGVPEHALHRAVDASLRTVALEDKRDVLAGALSGGMKRKLSVAIAFVGGSRTVILDEPTAGVDPFARRGILDMIAANKAGRTIVMSTHLMDEANQLSDRIVIIANGQLRCAGSALFLKSHFGVGYHLSLVRTSRDRESEQRIAALVASLVPSASLDTAGGAEMAFTLPYGATAQFPALFDALDAQTAALGIESYGVSVTTLEEVFVRVSEAVPSEQDPHRVPARRLYRWTQLWQGVRRRVFRQTARPSTLALIDNAPHLGASSMGADADLAHLDEPAEPQPNVVDGATEESENHTGDSRKPPVVSVKLPHAALLRGRALWMQQIRALWLKRMHHWRRDIKGFVSTLLVPAVFVCIALAVATTYPPPGDYPALLMSPAMFSAPTELLLATTVPPANVVPIANSTYAVLPSLAVPQETFRSVDPTPLSAYIIANQFQLVNQAYGAFSMSNASEVADKPSAVDYAVNNGTVWFRDTPLHAAPTYLNLWNSMLFRSMSNDSAALIAATYYPFPMTASDLQAAIASNGVSLVVAIFLIMALAFVPASFVLFVVGERASKAKHLQFVSGVGPFVYWVSTYMHDIATYLLPMTLIIILLAAFNVAEYTGASLGPITVLLLLYGFSMTPLMYIASIPFDVPSTAYVALISLNMFTGISGVVATFVLDQFPDNSVLTLVDEILQWALLLFPNYAMGRGILNIATAYDTNVQLANTFRPSSSSLTPVSIWGFTETGRNMLFMAVEGPVYFGLVILIEAHFFLRPKRRDQPRDLPAVAADDAGVVEAQALVRDRSPDAGDVLLLRELTKLYDGSSAVCGVTRSSDRKIAVNRLSMTVAPGECFGLLGVNGAGKTTTFRMLTGDLTPTAGDAYVNGWNIVTDRRQCQQHMGYCPQFDALNGHLTGREMLTLYARLHGLPEPVIAGAVQRLIKRLSLGHWADALCGNYSGGNKRKLSTGIALIGDPALVLLDEPSTGMDPMARRSLWDLIRAMLQSADDRLDGGNDGDDGATAAPAHGRRAVVLTTHSMEECEALCDRIGIMVNGQFRCLGTLQQLQTRYGLGYTLIVKAQPQDGRSDAARASARDRIAAAVPDAVLVEEQWGQLHYRVPPDAARPISRIFALLEAMRTECGVEDYSLSQTTLEQVFLRFAHEQGAGRDATAA